MPPRDQGWSTALKLCGRKAKVESVPSIRMLCGYRFPEPALFVSVKSPDSRKRYLTNWLTLRRSWIARVESERNLTAPGPKVWRTFLNSSAADSIPQNSKTKAGGLRVEAEQFFAQYIPARASGTSSAGNDDVSFRGVSIAPDTLTEPPVTFMQGILWELAELNFRYDLRALDQHYVGSLWQSDGRRNELFQSIFQAPIPGRSWDSAVPSSNSGTLFFGDFSSDPNVLGRMNAFSQLMSCWPGVPADFKQEVTVEMDLLEVARRAHQLRFAYIYSFYSQTGRPPVVPRFVPTR